MRYFGSTCACLFLLLLASSAAAVATGQGGVDRSFPEPTAFFRQVREAIRFDYELQRNFRYKEHRRDLRISKLGKVTIGPLRTFEVFPSSRPGGTYKRLIAIDGRPLDPAELARRDAEHERHVRERARETAEQRGRRLAEEAAERREREAIVDDAFAVFQPTFIRRELLEGESVLVAAIEPRAGARVATREGRWLKEFKGRVWIAEADRQIARIELDAIDDVTIGWGILGRVDEGSRFVFARRRVEGTWLPAEVTFDATGRTLLFRRFDVHVVTTYSDYLRARP